MLLPQHAHRTTPGWLFAFAEIVIFFAPALVESFLTVAGVAGVVGAAGAESSDTTICLTGMSGGTFNERSVSPTMLENTGPDT
jgi:hypothetical protein